MRGFTILEERGVLAITGPDRISFLDSLVTNAVTTAQTVYAALLNPQGRFLHDFFVIPDTDTLWLDCEAGRRHDLLDRLNRYRLRRLVELHDRTGEYAIIALPAAIPPFPGAILYPDPRHPDLGQRALVTSGNLPTVIKHLESTGLSLCSHNEYQDVRLQLGIPDGSRDIPPGHALPLEHNLDQLHAISFTKGCYVGQELTARMHHRGLVKKRLVPVRISTSPLPPSGTPVMAGEDEAGEIRTGIGHRALALLRLEFKGRDLCLNGEPVTAEWPSPSGSS